MRRVFGISIVILLLLKSFSLFALFESYNYYQYLIGERAAGMGGAYTALANDSTALWYNPAGLANITSSHLNISANSYSYLSRKNEGWFQFETTNNGINEIDLKQSDLSIVPNCLVFGLNLGKTRNINHTIAIGLFVPIQDNLKASMEGRTIDITSTKIKSRFYVENKYYLGLIGYGISLSPKFNIGLSIGFGYFKGTGEVHILSFTEGTTNKNQSMDSENTIEVLGFQSSIGVQYILHKNHKVGLYFQSPVFRITGKRIIENLIWSADTNGYSSDYEPPREEDDFISEPIPALLAFGYGFEISNSFAFVLDIVTLFKNEFKPNIVVNIKTGFEIYFSSDIVVRSGFFTDLSQEDEITVDSIDMERNNFYGFTLSTSFAKDIKLVKKDKIVKKRLWTTVGFVYRLGIGKIRVMRYNADFTSVSFKIKDQKFHRFSVFIAESITF